MATIWKVTVEQARTPDGVMVPAHGRHRTEYHLQLASLFTETQARKVAPSMLKLPPRMRVLNARRWKEVPR